MKSLSPWVRAGVMALAALLAAPGCSTTKSARRYSKDEASKTLERFEQTGLVIGEFAIDGPSSVIDGDTIRVKGLQNSLRLLGIDTEETFKHEWERKAFERGWESYLKEMRGDSARPVKMATPVGDGAKKWAQAFFEGVTQVRLERDHPGEIRDYYGRYLAYVFVQKDGKWLNYNLECVRAGWSPYFAKYGQSRRFHKQFVDAQRSAFEGKLHIWSDDELHYPDYAERLQWWDARGEQVARFDKRAEEDPTYIPLTRWDALTRLEQLAGQEVVVLGAVSQVKLGDKGPSVLKLSRSRGSDFNVVFWDKDVLLSSGALRARGEFIQVRGLVSKHLDKHRGLEQLQIVVSLPGQLIVPVSAQKLPEPPLVPTDDDLPATEEDPADHRPKMNTDVTSAAADSDTGVSDKPASKRRKSAKKDPAEAAFNEGN